MKKIKILNRYNDSILYEYACDNNTIKNTLEKAINSDANLRGADLRGADLRGADLSDADLSDADLSGADLSDADLSDADLSDADLSGADLSDADLSDADLSDADLRDADLSDADLSDADLSGADLRDADLRGADLRGADLRDADLRGADLRGADLRGADLLYLKSIRQIIPEIGQFIAWRKTNGYIIKIQIPSKSKRTCNIKSRKCRGEYVKTLRIENINGSKAKVRKVTHTNEAGATYEIGKITYPDKYDDNFLEDCTHGIHFFISREEAVRY